MTLGSIEHLQHYFTKTGLIAKEYVPGIYPLSCHLMTVQVHRPEKGPRNRILQLQLARQGETLVRQPSRTWTAPAPRYLRNHCLHPHHTLKPSRSTHRSSQSFVASLTVRSDVPTDASFSVSVMRVGGWRESNLVWDEVDGEFNVDEESERVPH